MPELPEVETVKTGLTSFVTGQTIRKVTLNRRDLRYPFADNFSSALENTKILQLSRRAKYLVFTLESKWALIVHLGMSGTIIMEIEPQGGSQDVVNTYHETTRFKKHDHVIIHLENGQLIYNDPRRFGFMEIWPKDNISNYPRFQKMGPEPLGNQFSAAYLHNMFKQKQTPVKQALLDQKIVVGLGNIYVCEALFRAGISPKRKASNLGLKRIEVLVPHIRDVLNEAIAAGGSSLKDFADSQGKLGYFQHNFTVYDRENEACPICGKPIRRIMQQNRSSFYCPSCQR